MQLDPTAYIRLNAPQQPRHVGVGRRVRDQHRATCSKSRAYGPGVFRLRVGANTKPDYGLVVGHAQRCDVAQPEPGVWSFAAGNARLELTGEPLQAASASTRTSPARLDHRRAFPRLHAPARDRPHARRRAVDRERSRSRPASRSTAWASNSARSTSAVSSSHRGSRTRSASTAGSPTNPRPSAGARAAAPARRAPGACSSTRPGA